MNSNGNTFFNDTDDIDALTKKCNELSNLPPASEESEADDDDNDDFAVIARAGSFDPDGTPLYRAYGISGKEETSSKTPLFSADGDPETGSDGKMEMCAIGLGSAFKRSLHKMEGLGYESQYQTGDVVKLKDENMPHMFVIVSNDGQGYELAKPTTNKNEFRQYGDGCWPRIHCEEDDIAEKLMYTIYSIEKILQHNDECDREMSEKLCPDCRSDTDYDTSRLGMHQLHEATCGASCDTGMNRAKEIRKDVMSDKLSHLKKYSKMDDNGHLVPDNDKIFTKISNRFDEIFGTGIKEKFTYDGGAETEWSDEPIGIKDDND